MQYVLRSRFTVNDRGIKSAIQMVFLIISKFFG